MANTSLRTLFSTNSGLGYISTKSNLLRNAVSISEIDLENIKSAGFKEVSLTDIYINEYYKTKEDLIALLLKVPILDDFSEIEENTSLKKKDLDFNLLDEYIKNNTTERGILLKRKYYGIIAKK